MGWRDVQYGESFGWTVVIVKGDVLLPSPVVFESLDEARHVLQRCSTHGWVCFLAKVVLVNSKDGE